MGNGPRDWMPPEPEPRWGERLPNAGSLFDADRSAEWSPFAEIQRHRRRRTLAWLWSGTAVLLVFLVVVVGGRLLPFSSREWIATSLPLAAPIVGIPAPDSDIVDLAHRTLLTDQARELLYRTSPQLLGDEVAEACARPSDEPGDEIVAQGCYAGWIGAGRIFIYRPSDDRLSGSMVTIAAHELLHAIYDRMDAEQQARVDALVAVETARLAPDDPTLAQIDWSVGDAEENRGTEQFAYLGSQVVLDGGFAPELEEIYARWFTDRVALVQTYRASIAVVTDLATQLQAAEDQLYAHEQAAVDARAQFDADQAWRDRAVPEYNADADRFNAMSPSEREQWTQTITLANGDTQTMSWSDALAYRLEEINRMNADLEARRPVIEQQEAEAASERSRVEALYADVKSLIAAAYPGRSE